MGKRIQRGNNFEFSPAEQTHRQMCLKKKKRKIGILVRIE